MRFGIIGTNWITDKLLDAGSQIENFELTAVYSRTEEKAREFADKYNVKNIFTDLKKMAESDLIDGVYIASPNSFHCEQSVLFLKHGKAVLCEKPSTSNSFELEKVINTAKENNTLYMEALKTTFIPTYNVLKENLHKIGKIRKVVANYCQHSSRYEDYKKGDVKNAFKKEFSNGALMDIGVYPLFFVISLFGSPDKITADGLIFENGKGIDGQGTVNMVYDEMEITVLYSKIANSYLPTEIMGEDGSLLIEHVSEMDKLYFIKRGSSNKIELTLPRKENSMYYELKHFVDLYDENKKESPINSFSLSLEVMDISKIGAFLDWGLEKELFLPFKEQTMKLEKGRKYLVALYIDKSERLCATMKIRDYLTSDSPYKEGEWVDGIIYSIHKDYGAFVAVEKKYDAMIENKDIVGVLEIGEPINFRISKVKKDGRLNLVLKNFSHAEINDNADILFKILKERNGFLELNDKSNPDKIKDICGMSKSSFKKAVGRLLKTKKIIFEGNGIKLI